MNTNAPARTVPYVNLAAAHTILRSELLEAVAAVIDSGQFILGPQVEAFERAFAAYIGTRFAVGVASGLDALVLALRVLGIGPGDEVITAPNSFVGSASCIALAGAIPVFADVGDDYNLDPNAVVRAMTSRTRAILPVHLTGRPARMERLMEIARDRNVRVIEDAAQAVGAALSDKKVGAFGDIGAFSLHPLKTLNACGDGGVITTNDPEHYERLIVLRNHGLKTRDDCVEFSGNSRLDTMQAAMLLVKLPHVGEWNAERRALAQQYRRELNGLAAVVLPSERPGEYAVYHTFVILAQRRDDLRRHLQESGIGTQVHYPVPIHMSHAARELGYRAGDFPVTEDQASRIVSLPIHHGLSSQDIEYVCDAIKAFYQGDEA
ncbi:MAG: DegT/DnrJ/EryC1/StrS family aminotransferase [Vulcanimicrobiaceae bacterium]